jgi:subtilisin family serine protease
VYSWATHGSHVAGIAGGGGAGTRHRGVAFEANFLMATFLVDEAAVIDAFMWMKQKSDSLNMPLVVNMSWGLQHLGPLDGTSILSRVIDKLSSEGVVFVASAGNNGGTRSHLSHTFNGDTINSGIGFFPYSAHEAMWGQSISMWGETGQDFEAGFDIYDLQQVKVYSSEWFNSKTKRSVPTSEVIIGSDTLYYNVEGIEQDEFNTRTHLRLRVKNTHSKYTVALKSTAKTGKVHYWNIVELTNDVGNWGLPFFKIFPDWSIGDSEFHIWEPACANSVISVGAYSASRTLPNNQVIGGQIAPFSSSGPAISGRLKPEITAPGVNLISSYSSFTDEGYTASETVEFKDRVYPFVAASGTSMSSPVVAGVVALMLDANPNLSPAEVKEIIQQTARSDEHTGVISDSGSTLWGFGKIDAWAAVKFAEDKRIQDSIIKVNKGIIVYPNPTSDKLMVVVPGMQLVNVEIFNNLGKQVYSGSLSEDDWVHVSGWLSGLYFVRLNDAAGTVRPILIQ